MCVCVYGYHYVCANNCINRLILLSGSMAYIRDVSSPVWKPFISWDSSDCKKVDDINRLRERNAGRPSSTPLASTDHVESDCGIGTDIQVYDGGVGLSYPVLTAAPPPYDTDGS